MDNKIKNNAVICTVFTVSICMVIKTDTMESSGIPVKQPQIKYGILTSFLEIPACSNNMEII